MTLNLKALRKQSGLTQEDLATRIGTTTRIVGGWERGETSISLIDAARIADVFDCSLDELAGRDFRPEGGYSDPRQAELNATWDTLDPERKSRLLADARDMSCARGARGAPVSEDGLSA